MPEDHAPPLSWRRRLALFILVVGPGLITANVDNDAGGIATYSVCGAKFGYSLVWSLIPICLFLVVVQEAVNRMGVVTGKGLADLIRERYGVKVTFYLMIGVFLTNFGNQVADFAGVAASAELLLAEVGKHAPVPIKYIAVPVSAILIWHTVTKGTYKSVERWFFIACTFYICYVIAGFMAKPQWGEVVREGLVPSFQFDRAYLMMLVGLVGTTIAPWMQFYQQASVVEKEIKIEHYRYSALDTVLGGVVVTVVCFFIVLTCGSTLHKAGIEIKDAADAAQALKPLAGRYCADLFAVGLMAAAHFAGAILPISTAFAVCEGFGWERGVNKNFAQAPQFYVVVSLMMFGGAAVVLIPNIPLIPVMIISQVLNGILLPFVLVFILLLINNRKIMRDWKNGPVLNAIAIMATVVVSTLTLVFTTLTVWELLS